MPTVEAFRVCIPDIEEQKGVAEKLSLQIDQAERVLDAVTDEAIAIDQLPAALLRRAFSGEL
jgi:hypothetical protein